MIKIQNLTSGEIKKVSNTKVEGGLVKSNTGKPLGQKFIRSWHGILTETTDENGEQVFTLSADWEIITKSRKPRQPKPAPVASTETPASADTEATEVETEPAEVEEEPCVENAHEDEGVQPQPQPAATVQTNGLNDALAAAFMPVFANVAANIESNIRASVQSEIDALKKQAATHVQTIKVVKEGGETHEVEGVFCEEFEDIVEDVNDGFMPYLWGAAGCGKTHTAEQVAKALGLRFYPQTTVQFAHDVRGYGNAAGEFVPTSFYKAFAEGGLYFQDEYDRSNPEASVVLNTALANGYYDFPVIGRVQAHPQFRFMAAGNTRMQGADEEYVSGQVQDASSRDRVVFYEMSYDRRVELPCMAQGDEELVDFVEDVRRAIKNLHISHVVSYRETKYMKAREDKKEKALIRSTFKGLELDAIRLIYGELQNKENAWARALKNLI